MNTLGSYWFNGFWQPKRERFDPLKNLKDFIASNAGFLAGAEKVYIAVNGLSYAEVSGSKIFLRGLTCGYRGPGTELAVKFISAYVDLGKNPVITRLIFAGSEAKFDFKSNRAEFKLPGGEKEIDISKCRRRLSETVRFLANINLY